MSFSKQLFADMRERESSFESAYMRGVDDYYEQQQRIYDSMQEDEDHDDTVADIVHFECSYRFKNSQTWVTFDTAATSSEGFKKINELRKKLRGKIDNKAVKIIPVYKREFEAKEVQLNRTVERAVLGF